MQTLYSAGQEEAIRSFAEVVDQTMTERLVVELDKLDALERIAKSLENIAALKS